MQWKEEDNSLGGGFGRLGSFSKVLTIEGLGLVLTQKLFPHYMSGAGLFSTLIARNRLYFNLVLK